MITNTFNKEKNLFLNYPKIIEYMFNKPTYIKNMRELVNIQSDVVRIIRLREIDKKFIEHHIDLLYGFRIQKYTFKNIISKYISKKLDAHETPNGLLYVPDWSFDIIGSETSSTARARININSEIKNDFFGIIMAHGQLAMFAIDYDINKKDPVDILINQYMLYQYNIHYLTLDNCSIRETGLIIDKFITEIKNTDKYTRHGYIKLGLDEMEFADLILLRKSLETFISNYKYNHKIFMKMPASIKTIYNTDDENFIYKKYYSKDIDYADPMVGSIDDQNLKYIVDSKKYYHPTCSDKAEKILIELVGKPNIKQPLNITKDALECISGLRPRNN